jgi:hypothetical protein
MTETKHKSKKKDIHCIIKYTKKKEKKHEQHKTPQR